MNFLPEIFFDIGYPLFFIVATFLLTRYYYKPRTDITNERQSFPDTVISEKDPIKLLENDTCDYGRCKIRYLSDCAADYCHRHCLEFCKCGAGAIAGEFIEQYGNLRAAERFLNSEKNINAGTISRNWSAEQ